jgi:hypothetical protein
MVFIFVLPRPAAALSSDFGSPTAILAGVSQQYLNIFSGELVASDVDH